ncbi:tyrosine-type recombinase/integrase [Brevibacillus porteri]|uniref:Integrase n=1 Tax=Brevibacillus porteri TaxID=2126350 RepID=A0ABX5FJ25_9BACL|nr:tyrosine-type recombinase/integrase [Brevibacillus porteri]MED1802928.1 tyrosine-type recombinase/integrase [Brevibacillus porteri]MED2135104.1 tyrosine-type recombinase/integrase [Brevibacillus porteri]MED2746346.1 tyrosine-type recombinase/integrase [Brevibacillus porteri]MED2817930.1 tyrosine-type recombinase/integrase [Brevibacillus porteri]MED2895562.1 tyrosine-type recombinase/integrase [Brevibacillus porteri]
MSKRMVKGRSTTSVQASRNYTLDEAFQLFVKVKEAEGKRKRTLHDYRKHWGYFRKWLEESHPQIEYIRQVTSPIARDYHLYMASDRSKYQGVSERYLPGVKLAPATVAIRLRTFRAMFRFWKKEGVITEDPTTNLKPAKEDEEEIVVFSEEQLMKMMSAANKKSYKGYRDWALMMTLADTGLRIQEAMALSVDMLDFPNKMIRLPASLNKNRKARVVPFSEEVSKALNELIEETGLHFETKNVFVDVYGKPLTSDAVRKIFRRYAEKAGLLGKVKFSPHIFRHYFCTQYLLNGGDIATLQRIVGHANISTTRKYLQVDFEHIRSQHDKYSPITRLLSDKNNSK